MLCDKLATEDSEWPALGDVSKNRTDGRHPRKIRNSSKDSKNDDNVNGSAPLKENNGEIPNTKSGASKKKKLNKINWQPLQIETQPYRKKGAGRYSSEMARSAENNKNHRSRYESNHASDNARGNFRNGGFKGKRGRQHATYRSYEEGANSPEMPSDGLANGIIINGVTFFPQTFSDATLKNFIKRQMEYYFSDKNLTSDVYLRLKMDNLGFAPLSIFLNFPRIMTLTRDINVLVEAVAESNKLELQYLTEQWYVRRVVDPLGWPISNQFHNHNGEHGNDIYPGIGFVGDAAENAMNEISSVAESFDVANGYAVSLNESYTSLSPVDENDFIGAHVNGDCIGNVLPSEDNVFESKPHSVSEKKTDTSVPVDNGNTNYTPSNDDDSENATQNADNSNIAISHESNSNIVPLVCQIENLHIDDTAPYTYNPLHVEPTEVQYVPSFDETLSSTISPSTASPPEIDIELNGVFIENKAVNGCNYYSHPSRQLEQANGCDFYTETVYNDVIFYDTNELSNQGPLYYVVNSNKLLSSSSDNSTNEALHMSPEPSR